MAKRARATKPVFIPCSCHPDLSPDLVMACARTAVAENPANAPPPGVLASLLGTALAGAVDHPQMIAVMTSKYWGSKGRAFGVQFLDAPTAACKAKILAHMNAWNARCNVSFKESSQGEIRISRGSGGYWSYLGTDILQIPSGQPTMNLQGFTESTPDSEYKRVVRHETGHTLGCPHEHMRRAIVSLLDRAKTLAYFQRTQGWSQQTTIQQVLTPVEEASLMTVPGGPVIDDESVMCYQLPGDITLNGKPIPGGVDILESDYAYMSRLYPKDVPPVSPPPPPPSPPVGADTVLMEVAVPDAVRALQSLGYTVTK